MSFDTPVICRYTHAHMHAYVDLCIHLQLHVDYSMPSFWALTKTLHIHVYTYACVHARHCMHTRIYTPTNTHTHTSTRPHNIHTTYTCSEINIKTSMIITPSCVYANYACIYMHRCVLYSHA